MVTISTPFDVPVYGILKCDMERFLEKQNSTFEADPSVERDKELAENKYDFRCSKEERRGFNEWMSRTPDNSEEKPIAVHSIEDARRFLPTYPNYTDKKINLFFSKEKFTDEELFALLESFSHEDPVFEISTVRHSDSIISVGVGGKAGNRSTIFAGEYIGHNHPTKIEFENKENLPVCFIKGLMPSVGDIKGFLRFPDCVKNGTRIFSKYGYVFIKPVQNGGDRSSSFEDFSKKYFQLFLGKNKLGIKSDEEVAKYFKDEFGFEIEFHYF